MAIKAPEALAEEETTFAGYLKEGTGKCAGEKRGSMINAEGWIFIFLLCLTLTFFVFISRPRTN